MSTFNFITEEELQEMLEFLDNLRDSGVTNMFGAGIFLESEFGLDKKEAKSVLIHWMKTYGRRHNGSDRE